MFLHAPEAEIVFLVVVEVIDMDDLEVIRLAVKEIIPEGRIAREGMDVKEKFGKWRRKRRKGPLPDPSTSFSLGPRSSLGRETPVPRKGCEGKGFQVALRLVPSWSQAWQIQAFIGFLNASRKGKVE